MNDKTDSRLSPEQIKNWRTYLTAIVGPYALIMPDSEVQRIKDELQKQINQLSQEAK